MHTRGLMVNTKTVSVALVVVLLSCVLVGTPFISVVVADPTIIHVPDEYPTIQVAINVALDGDIIHVAAGIYYEHLTVYKPLTLRGENRDTTIIDGGDTDVVIQLAHTRNVTITGFTIQNSGGLSDNGEPMNPGINLFHSNGSTIVNNHISNNDLGISGGGYDHYISDNVITANGLGIFLENTFQSTITHNTVQNNTDTGIILLNSSDCRIDGNTISNTGMEQSGISIERSNNINITGNTATNNRFGIHLSASSGCLIDGNTASNNHQGIHLDGSTQNRISNNTVTDNEFGIELRYSRNNTVTDNLSENVFGGYGVGIILQSSDDNTIYHNNFIDNPEQLNLHDSASRWDNGAEGNYWSDYAGVDQNADGVGDTILPHLGVDNYPLMAPWTRRRVFSAVWEGASYTVTIVSNATVAGFAFTQPLKTIGFNVTGPPGASGFCTVTLPHALLDGPFTVLINDFPGDSVLTANDTHSSLYFTYHYSTHRISIIGTTVVPDTISPIADAGPDQTVNEDTVVTFDGSGSSDNGLIATYTWTFLDGPSQTLTGVNPTYTFATSGTYTVTLTVFDMGENGDDDTVTLTVVDVTTDTDGDGIPDATDTDDDNDEMPDTWETDHGLNPLDAADAALDPDSDGVTNLHEYQQNTDPHNSYSPFPLWIAGVAVAAVAVIVIIVYVVRGRKTAEIEG